jgi:putative transcriptional regulator
MGIKLNFDQAIFKWQAKHNERMTYAELAKRASITEPTIYRLTSGQATKLDLDKLNRICKVLECEPGDLLERVVTAPSSLEEAEWQMRQRAEEMKILEDHTKHGKSPESG